MEKIIVVGAGFSGATIARLFAESGKDVIVIDELNFEAPSTKAAVEVLSKVNAKAKTLIVISEDNDNLVASARNIPGVIVVKTNNLSVYDILNSDSVVFTKESVKAVEGGLA